MIWSLQFRMTITTLIFENPILLLYSVAYHLVPRRCTRNKVLNNVYLVIQRVSNALDLIKLIVSRVIPVTSWLMGNAKRVVHKVWNLLIFSMQSLNSWSNNWSLNVWNRGVLLPKKTWQKCVKFIDFSSALNPSIIHSNMNYNLTLVSPLGYGLCLFTNPSAPPWIRNYTKVKLEVCKVHNFNNILLFQIFTGEKNIN